MHIARFAILAGFAGLLAAAAPTVEAAPGPGIVLFQEDNFGGDRRALHEDVPDLSRIRFDDRVSSLEVRRGIWELCEHAYYRGRCITVDHDVAKLSRLGFDDRTTSIRRIH